MSTTPSPVEPGRGRAWASYAASKVRGVDAPTIPIALPGGDEAVSQHVARAVIDVALRVGEAMLATGASASAVVATVLRLTSAYGLRSTHVDITFTSLTVSIHRGLDEDPLTVMRVVRLGSPDYNRLREVQLLVDQVADAEPEHVPAIGLVRRQLGEILSAPHSYRKTVVALGQALVGAGVVLLLGGGPVMILIAGLTAASVHQLCRRLYKSSIPAFFVQAVGAAIPTLVAVVMTGLEDRGVDLQIFASPSLVAVAGIVVLLAGLTVVGAAQDAIDGNYVTASARGTEVGTLTVGIAIGVSLVLSLAERFDVSMTAPAPGIAVADPVTSTVAAALMALGYALTTHTGLRATAVSALLGAAVWTAYLAASALYLHQATTVAIAAVVAGAVGHVVQVRLRVSELAITTAAIVCLLPGLSVYDGLQQLVGSGYVTSGLTRLVNAAGIGLGLAAGVSVGGYLARRLFGLDPTERQALRGRRRTGTPGT